MEITVCIIDMARAYSVVGLSVAVAFLFIGLDRVDEDARGTYVFRLLLIPGIVLLWPVIVVRWMVLERNRRRAQT